MKHKENGQEVLAMILADKKFQQNSQKWKTEGIVLIDMPHKKELKQGLSHSD